MPTMLQRAFGRVAGSLGAVAEGPFSSRLGMYARGAAGHGAVGAAGVFGANPAAARALVGGTLGGAYGAFSDNTSIAGGAAMGAGLFAGAPLAAGRAKGMYGAYSMLRDAGRGRGRALMSVLHSEGMASKQFIKRSYTRAVNGIGSTLKAGGGGLGTIGF